MKKTKKEIYFEFYDKLPYPINSWAKLNYDDSFSKDVPKSLLEEALLKGWNWNTGKFIESGNFWDSVRLNVDNKSKLLTLAKDAIRKHYYKYYDQIPDKIIAEKAKFNYDNHLEVRNPLRDWLPSNTDEALGSGFSFEHAPEGYDYWRAILNSLPSDTLKKSTEIMSPRKQKSFEFYDLLPSPIKEWAKENFDESYSTMLATSIREAILDGWNFGKSKNNCNNGFWVRVANIDIDDQIEVKRLTDEALNCKIPSKTETMSDLKKKYFEFYKKLSPLLCEWACANFDEDFAKNRHSPFNLYTAINTGWSWINSKHGDYDLWQKVSNNVSNTNVLLEIENEISTKSDTKFSIHLRSKDFSGSMKDTRRNLFFRYYDKLPYPISDMAKANYNPDYSTCSVHSITSALYGGFDETLAKWGSNIFWKKVLNSLYRFDRITPDLVEEAFNKFGAVESYSSSFNNLNNSNQNQNEKQKSEGIQVSRVTPSISTGERRISNPIQGARSKTSIAIGHLSNAKISTCG